MVQWLRPCLLRQGGAGSIPVGGAKIPHALWPKKKDIKQKQYYNKFNKDFKNGPHPKNLFKTKYLFMWQQLCVPWLGFSHVFYTKMELINHTFKTTLSNFTFY